MAEWLAGWLAGCLAFNYGGCGSWELSKLISVKLMVTLLYYVLCKANKNRTYVIYHYEMEFMNILMIMYKIKELKLKKKLINIIIC